MRNSTTDLQHLQVLQPLLHQLLYPPRVVDTLVLPERIPRAALGIFPKVVGVELVSLAEELSVLRSFLCQPPRHLRGKVEMKQRGAGQRSERSRKRTSDRTFCADSGLIAAWTADMASYSVG